MTLREAAAHAHLAAPARQMAPVVNGPCRDHGLMETIRARKSSSVTERVLERLKRENAAIRDQAYRVRTDSATIESGRARGELGLAREGKVLVTIRDTK